MKLSLRALLVATPVAGAILATAGGAFGDDLQVVVLIDAALVTLLMLYAALPRPWLKPF